MMRGSFDARACLRDAAHIMPDGVSMFADIFMLMPRTPRWRKDDALRFTH